MIRKKHIAFMGIKGLPHGGGAESVVGAIVERMDYERYDVSVYCDKRLIPSTASVPNIRLLRVNTLPGKHIRALSLFLSSLLDALFSRDFDLIHLHNVESSFVLPFLRIRYDVIATSHGQAQNLEKWSGTVRRLMGLMEYPFVRWSNETTSVSRTLASYYESKFGRHTFYIPNGVEPPRTIAVEEVNQVLSEVNLKAGYILFAAGRIIPIKGCHLLLEAHNELPKEATDLVIIGDLTQVPEYKQQLDHLTGDGVTFIPFISDKDVLFSHIKACRFFVFPSLVEAMSIMLLEVASMGVPIICSDISANVDVLEGHALFFASGDANDLRDKIYWALEHEKEMETMAAGAQEHVQENFNWNRIVEQYQELYG